MSDRQERNKSYLEIITAAEKLGEDQLRLATRQLCLNDLFFLLTKILGRAEINNDWLYDRCNEVQAHPDGHIDLWAREHFKSSIITYGKTIQDILIDPEITVGIFSHTKPIARAFLRQIKAELETNAKLKLLFPEILYENPRKEALNWSEDKGITVKRKNNPKEATVEAYGLVDGQPTSKHYSLLVYDDVVTKESVSTTEMIKKVTDSWALSLNLGTEGGRVRYIGTRYHANDTYKTIMKRGSAVPRVYPGTDDGTVNGKAVLLTDEAIAKKRRDQGAYVFACQILQNPQEDDAQKFEVEWIKHYNKPPDTSGMNTYILVDPANEKTKKSDYTCIWVIALGADKNYYVLFALRDRLNLTERTNRVISLYKDYEPAGVGYEKYGLQSDIQHIEYVQEEINYRFSITPLGGNMSKNDRIRQLIPVFEQRRIYFPHTIMYTDYEGKTTNMVQSFINDELEPFPFCVHDDMLDSLARIKDPKLGASFPLRAAITAESILSPSIIKMNTTAGSSAGWMSS